MLQSQGRTFTLTIFVAMATLAGASAAAADTPAVRVNTSAGSFDIELYEKQAPHTVANFLQLVDDDFYDGLIFHRVLANFVIQAGGYDAQLNFREAPRTVVNESANGLRNRKTTLSMARLPDPDSADAQFFINVKDNRTLDAAPGKPGYTVFGAVTDGWDVVETIELADTASRDQLHDVPVEPVVIESMERIDAPEAP